MTTPQSEEQPQPAPAAPPPPPAPVATPEPRAAPAPVVEFEESLSLDKLAGALAKAQGGMTAAKKDTANPFFKTRYADLAAVWDVIRKPLSENGLAIIQRPTARTTSVTVVTDMVHESGQWIRMRLTLPLAQQTAQGVGSAITYARRYSITALTGVAAEDDDDGAAASQEPGTHRPNVDDYTRPPPPKPEAKPGETAAERAAKAAAEAERKQLAVRVKRLWSRAQEEKQLDKDGFKRWSIGVLGVEKPSVDWTAEELSKLEADFA